MNIGVLGFAHGHVNMYLNAWRNEPDLGVTPLAGWDHDAGRLAQAVEQNGFTGYDDVEKLIAGADIDAVVIASETAMHADLVERAAKAGKAIVLQKPLALTMSEADRIVAAVEKSGVPFTMAWQMRVDPQNLKMREMVKTEALGKVFSLRRRHGLGMHRSADSFGKSWHVDPAMNRDIWADDAAHPIDFIHWMFGKPEAVTAEIITAANNWMPNDNGTAIFRYPNGPLVEVTCSFTCLAAENTTEIYAEAGVVIQSFGDGPASSAPRPEGLSGLKWFAADDNKWSYSDIPSPASQGERIAALAGPIADFLNGRREAIASAAEARTSLEMVLACYVSSREGRRVSMDDPAIALI